MHLGSQKMHTDIIRKMEKTMETVKNWVELNDWHQDLVAIQSEDAEVPLLACHSLQ